MKTKILAAITVATILALTALTFSSHRSHAQSSADSDDLAKFVAIMQYIRSQPTPSDVKADNIPLLSTLDTSLSEIYITGFISPYTGETPDQVKARLQSVPEADRFTAVMVESYRLASDSTLLDLIHALMSRYYVELFITNTDLSGASAYLRRAEIESLADNFDSSDYAIPMPSTTGSASPLAQSQDTVDSDDLAKFVAIMQYIRSQPTPSDVKADNIPLLSTLDTSLSEIYITGFISPYTGETPNQVRARLQSVPEEDRFTAVMVESYRLAPDSMLLDLIHALMSRYYVELFITNTDLSGASAYLRRAEVESLADNFDPADYTIPASSTTEPADTGSPEMDRATLVALYNATDGDNWSWNFNWLTDEPLDEWSGVTTDDDGRVVELNLRGRELTGAVPPELANLTKLTSLSLSSNQLTGSIPSELGKLSNLTILSLWGNDLSGGIPPELGDLSNLKELILHNNGLTGAIPPELGKLTNLEDLFLAGNRLSGDIPSELGSLSNLEFLSLAGNDLGGCIPNTLGDTWSSDLSEIGLTFCASRASDPADRAVLEAFYTATGGPNWSTSTNWLSDKPMGLWYGVATDSDGRLIGLSLPSNQLSGSIPANLGNLSNLEFLSLAGNQLGGSIPPDLGNLTNLTRLYLYGNQLDGSIPSDLGNLTNLTRLYLFGNQLDGSIPSDLGNLTNLTWLNLDGNRLSGAVPPQLGNLSNLQLLYLRNNDLSGALPQSLTRITGLRVFRFGGNSGELCAPDDEAFQAWLQAIRYRSGPNCAAFADRDVLIALYNATDGPNWSTSTNWLSDRPIREWHGVFTNWETGRVEGLSLGGNNLSGSIPPELGNLTELKDLYLWRNQLGGSIPLDLGNLTKLEGLQLQDNQLTGPLPQTFTSLAGLERFDFGNNDGLCAPTDAAFTAWLQAIPNWSGPDCEQVKAIASDRAALVALYNATDGPNWTDNTNWLSDEPLRKWHGVGTNESGRVDRLSLDKNGLSGSIPPELGDLANLERLYLWGNQLSGVLPQSLTQITVLESFWFGNFDENDGLCAPTNTTFMAWLQAIPRWGGVSCGDPADRAILIVLYNATDGPNWADSANWLSDKPLEGWYGVGTDRTGRVDWLGLYDNQLSGSIPSELGDLTNLESLSLQDNQLTGPIPEELGKLAELDWLSLNHNDLSGEIPPALGNLASLEALYLRENEWTGCIPNALGDTLRNDLYRLGLSFCDPRASDTSDKVILEAFYNATGGPKWNNTTNWLSEEPMGLWRGVATDSDGRVTALNLGDNRLSGSIPSQLGDLTNLRRLNLSHNLLSGAIPPQLGNLSKLEYLNLGDNLLGDGIPPQLGNLANLEVLRLHDNQLTGSIPSQLGNLANLEWVEFGGNNLSGCIPHALQNVRDDLDDELGLDFCTQ